MLKTLKEVTLPSPQIITMLKTLKEVTLPSPQIITMLKTLKEVTLPSPQIITMLKTLKEVTLPSPQIITMLKTLKEVTLVVCHSKFDGKGTPETNFDRDSPTKEPLSPVSCQHFISVLICPVFICQVFIGPEVSSVVFRRSLVRGF